MPFVKNSPLVIREILFNTFFMREPPHENGGFHFFKSARIKKKNPDQIQDVFVCK